MSRFAIPNLDGAEAGATASRIAVCQAALVDPLPDPLTDLAVAAAVADVDNDAVAAIQAAADLAAANAAATPAIDPPAVSIAAAVQAAETQAAAAQLVTDIAAANAAATPDVAGASIAAAVQLAEVQAAAAVTLAEPAWLDLPAALDNIQGLVHYDPDRGLITHLGESNGLVHRLSDGENVAATHVGGHSAITTDSGYMVSGAYSSATHRTIYWSDGPLGVRSTTLEYDSASGAYYVPHSVCEARADEVFVFEYGSNAAGNRIWYSADGGQHFGTNAPAYDDGNPLITALAGVIAHFHGGSYNDGVLYVMTGDAIAQNTVLKCADIDDLLANPATWATRWGLDDAGRTGLDPAYCVNDNLSPTTGLPTDSAYRTTSLAFDGGYVYWGMDASPYAIYKQHLATGVRTALGNSIGVAWRWLKTAAGDLIFAADSEYAHIGSDADENVRLYAVNAARTGLVVLRVWPRDDAAAPVGNVQFGNSLFQTAAGVIYATCYPGYIGPIKGKDVAGVILPAGTDIREWLAETPTTLTLSRTMTQAARTNFVREPLFATVATWTAAAGCTMAQEAVVVPDGIASSAKATPDASVTESYIYFDFGSTGNLGLYFPKRTLSLTVKVWLPAEQHGGQAPAIQIYNGAAASNLLMLPVADFDGAWHEYTLVTTIVTGATRPLVRLYAHKGAADAAAVDPIYWTDVRCGWGCEALPSRA